MSTNYRRLRALQLTVSRWLESHGDVMGGPRVAEGRQHRQGRSLVPAWRQLLDRSASQSCRAGIEHRQGGQRPGGRCAAVRSARATVSETRLVDQLPEGGPASTTSMQRGDAGPIRAPSPARTSRCPPLFRAYHLGLAMFVRMALGHRRSRLRPAPPTGSTTARPIVDFVDKVCEQVGKTYEASAISGSATAAGYDSIG